MIYFRMFMHIWYTKKDAIKCTFKKYVPPRAERQISLGTDVVLAGGCTCNPSFFHTEIVLFFYWACPRSVRAQQMKLV